MIFVIKFGAAEDAPIIMIQINIIVYSVHKVIHILEEAAIIVVAV